MKNQNFENHRHFDPMFHVAIFLGILLTLILSFIFFIQNIGNQLLLSSIVLFGSITLLLLALKVRAYVLKLQDRIIRNEENFRSFRLTGTQINSNLTLKQIIALRFASDEEFIELSLRAVEENLSANEIKKAVENWRADHHRV